MLVGFGHAVLLQQQLGQVYCSFQFKQDGGLAFPPSIDDIRLSSASKIILEERAVVSITRAARVASAD
jgi:hypothetical protein